jgi:uncharacterized membrane protein YfcA
VALGIVLPLLMVGDMTALWALRGNTERAVLRVVLPGAVVGVTAASLLLNSLPPEAIEWSLAVIVTAFAIHRLTILTGRTGTEPDRLSNALAGSRGGAVAGAAAGLTSTLAHAGGPPLAMHLLSRNLQPVRYAATSAALFWAINWMKVPAYAAAGLVDLELLRSLAPTALAIVPGVFVGRWVVERIPRRPFEVFVLVSLLAGVVLLLVR